MGENGQENGNGHRPRLTGLQRAFVEAWFGEAQFNNTEAARLAGYSGGDDPKKERDVWAVQAAQVLRNIKVQEEIELRWAAHGVTPSEVVATLTKQMRASVGDFIDEHGVLNLKKIKEDGRGIVQEVIHEKGKKSRIKLYSSQHAAEQIGKILGLYRQQVDLDVTTKGESLNVGYTDEQRARAMVSILDGFRAELLRPGGNGHGAMDTAEHATGRGDVLSSR